MNVISYVQARPILQARARGETAVLASLDLNLTATEIPLTNDGLSLPEGGILAWLQLEEIAANEQVCYHVDGGDVQKIQYFSETFNRFYSLYPTQSAPTMLVAGFPMHRIKGTDPYRDTLSKIKAIAPVRGQVLDTTMGLGYTAIEAAKTADQLTTIELDPTVLDICRHNPWSQGLFDSTNITRLIGDAYDVVAEMNDGRFHCIIHDPPTFSLAGELYSAEFYRQLGRILKAKGKLFHYIGDPNSKSGRSVRRGVMQRLQDAGFRYVKPRPQAFGVVAYK
jgi:predicted methyltransferase